MRPHSASDEGHACARNVANGVDRGSREVALRGREVVIQSTTRGYLIYSVVVRYEVYLANQCCAVYVLRWRKSGQSCTESVCKLQGTHCSSARSCARRTQVVRLRRTRLRRERVRTNAPDGANMIGFCVCWIIARSWNARKSRELS